MMEYLDKKELWVTPKTTRLWKHQIRRTEVKDFVTLGSICNDGR